MRGEAGATVAVADILGCWTLERALEERGGVVAVNPVYGENAKGFLHYLAEGRVAVVIALGERPLMSGPGRRTASVDELAEAARTFDAYAGRFSLIGPDRIAHHVEVASYQNHVGNDLVRRIELEGDLLRLHVPPFDEGGTIVRRWLEWRRLGARKGGTKQ